MNTHWKNNSAPEAPFYAVIFISRKGESLEGYAEMDARMMAEAQQQPGYLGYSSVNDKADGIFISYWQDEQSIEKWRRHAGHRQAKTGAPSWYSYYHSMVTKVLSSKVFEAEF